MNVSRDIVSAISQLNQEQTKKPDR